jgi:hypothetical protein
LLSVIVQVPFAAVVVEPRGLVPSRSVTPEPASAVPPNTTVGEARGPVSAGAVIAGAAGVEVSICTVAPVETGDRLPAASIAVAA